MEGECATNERTAPPLHACLPACLILLWLAGRVTADWLAACISILRRASTQWCTGRRWERTRSAWCTQRRWTCLRVGSVRLL